MEIESTFNPSREISNADIANHTQESDIVLGDDSNNSVIVRRLKETNYESTIYYLYYVTVHIFVFSVFESLFFWLYITEQEDQAIMKQIEDIVLVGDLFCVNANDDIDLTPIYTHKEKQRSRYNQEVPFNNTMMLNGYLAVLLVLCNFLMKISSMRVLEVNLKILRKQTPMFIMLFAYEYLFFSNIIYNYTPNSANKIMKEIFKECL